jgi:hypothetical protein
VPRNAQGACTLCPGPPSWARIEAYLVSEQLVSAGVHPAVLLDALLGFFVARWLMDPAELLHLGLVRARVAG